MKEDTNAGAEVPFLDPANPVSIRGIERLTVLDRRALDDLPIGVIQVDREGTILEYNRAETRLAGKVRDEVLGKNFFTDVAPCTNVRQFAGRFRTDLGPGKPPVVFPFEFSFPKRRVHVTILMHFDAENDRGWIFVQESPVRRRRR